DECYSLHLIGNDRKWGPDPPIAWLEDVGEIVPLVVEHHTQARELASLELRLIGQISSRVIEELDHLAEVDHRIGNVLVLAELVIGGVQIGKVDAVKPLDVGTDRLRVVQCGGDKVVEVDGLD